MTTTTDEEVRAISHKRLIWTAEEWMSECSNVFVKLKFDIFFRIESDVFFLRSFVNCLSKIGNWRNYYDHYSHCFRYLLIIFRLRSRPHIYIYIRRSFYEAAGITLKNWLWCIESHGVWSDEEFCERSMGYALRQRFRLSFLNGQFQLSLLYLRVPKKSMIFAEW